MKSYESESMWVPLWKQEHPPPGSTRLAISTVASLGLQGRSKVSSSGPSVHRRSGCTAPHAVIGRSSYRQASVDWLPVRCSTCLRPTMRDLLKNRTIQLHVFPSFVKKVRNYRCMFPVFLTRGVIPRTDMNISEARHLILNSSLSYRKEGAGRWHRECPSSRAPSPTICTPHTARATPSHFRARLTIACHAPEPSSSRIVFFSKLR